mmetsp:Transcript_74001/g.117701  ORF Transcript_74001/g.117701 Transcript_74001/m.117701 type:complete len:96 (+) Transcript_74001:1-288(+)
MFVDHLSDREKKHRNLRFAEMDVQTKGSMGSTGSWEEGHGQPHFLDVDLKPLLLDEDRDFKLVTSQKELGGDGKVFKRQLTPVNIGASKRPRSDR